jgi:hypothetical protein
MATGTGSTLLLTPNQDLVANNHTYRLTGAGSLFGTGLVDGVSLVASGYIEIEVDSVAAKIRFDIAGCASPLGSGTALGEYSYSARVSRQVAGCASCTPDTVLRNFTVTETNAQGSTSYTFENGSAPAGCSIGVDLIRFTLG